MASLKVVVGGFAAVFVVAFALIGLAHDEAHIHACVNTQGRLRIVADGWPCDTPETPLEWNCTLRKGWPKGRAGPGDGTAGSTKLGQLLNRREVKAHSAPDSAHPASSDRILPRARVPSGDRSHTDPVSSSRTAAPPSTHLNRLELHPSGSAVARRQDRVPARRDSLERRLDFRGHRSWYSLWARFSLRAGGPIGPCMITPGETRRSSSYSGDSIVLDSAGTSGR